MWNAYFECEGACDEQRLACVRDIEGSQGEDCATSLCSDKLVCATDAARSTCERMRFAALGEPCTPGLLQLFPCDVGQHCDSESETCALDVIVEEGACSPFGNRGAQCASSFSTRQCVIDPDDILAPGVCATRPTTGEVCDGFEVCEQDVATCRPELDVGERVRRAVLPARSL